ncbi:MAG: DDE-type integrase/transposase/recombinase [Pyrinomonadaceae bacterium]
MEFMLSAKRDVSAAKRFLKKLMRADYRRLPFTICVDKNAAYPEAFSYSQAERTLEGIEAMNMMRKGQVKRLAGSDAQGQAKFVASLFGAAA